MYRSSWRECVDLIEPVVPIEEGLERDAQLELAGVVQEFEDEVIALELEAGPDLAYAAWWDRQGCLFFALFVN